MAESLTLIGDPILNIRLSIRIVILKLATKNMNQWIDFWPTIYEFLDSEIVCVYEVSFYVIY